MEENLESQPQPGSLQNFAPEPKKFPKYLILILVIAGLTIVGYFVLGKTQNLWPFQACTEEAKICPDGSTVGRSGLFCRFESCPGEEQLPREKEILDLLEKEWPSFSESLSVKPVLGSMSWGLSAIQFVASDKFLIYFEDGHISHLALLKINNGEFEVIKLYFNKAYFSAEEYNNILSVYGNKNYIVTNYARSILRGTEIISFGKLTQVDENQFLSPYALGISTVKIALIARGDEGKQGKKVGCEDSVVYVERNIPKTTQPLNEAFKQLFSLGTSKYQGFYNIIYNLQEGDGNLKFDHATIENNVAKIYLTGAFRGFGGICDEPRLPAQIEETAKQFSNVENVETYLNGELVDWSAMFK